MTAEDSRSVDVLIVGGGLAGSLIALRLADERPSLRVRVLEGKKRPDSNRTWCLFSTDVSPQQWNWLQPLFACEWKGYDVAFPDFTRTLKTRYACITGESLTSIVERRLGKAIQHDADVVSVDHRGVECRDGSRWFAPLVLDARGASSSTRLALCWQKFVGLEVTLRAPHGLERPMVMDAREPQLDGFRFLYLLPLGPDRILIEDTRYSDSTALDESALEAGIREYATRRGFEIAQVIRRERGVLPVVLGGDIQAFWDEQNGSACVGLRGAFFHPTTGYSLPEAARTAEWIATQEIMETASIASGLRARSVGLWERRGFYRTVNRILFLAAEPTQRFRVLQRFYRLSAGLIERFYGGGATFADKSRVLIGRPPVAFGRAIRALPESAALGAPHV